MIYDAESLLTDILALVKSKLNTRLAAIDAEKNDGITMLPIPAEAYFFQDMLHESAPVYDVLCLYGMEDPVPNSIAGATAEDHTLYFVVVLKETAELTVFTTRLLRYTRALREIVERDFSNNRNRCKLLVSSISPTRFAQAGVKGSWRAVGVKVQTTLA